jgi:hypothetical protein
MAQSTPSADDTVWLDTAHTQPYLIPESRLAQVDWTSRAKSALQGLPLTAAQASALRQRVARQLAATKSTSALPSCDPAPLREFARPEHGPLSLAAFVESAPIAIVGRVDRVIGGWSPSLERPVSQVRLTVETVLRDATGEGAVAASSPVSYLLSYGDIQLGRARLCQEAGTGEYTPRAGDRVLIVGYADKVNAGNLHPIGFFEIADGKVQPRSHAALASREPQPLSALIQALQPAAPRKD